MKVVWNRVTRFSQAVAIILFVAIFLLGFGLGRHYENGLLLGKPVATAKFACDGDKVITADFYKHFVHISALGLGSLYLPQTISASGARYANDDESLVFWNKGDTAFVTQGNPNQPTFANCVIASGQAH